MSSTAKYLTRFVSTAAGLLVVVGLVGCHGSTILPIDFAKRTPPPEPVAEPVAPATNYAANPEQLTSVARRSPNHGGVPDGMTLFGDRPDQESVPFETRLVTNVTRHTDTTEGLDFDPDIFDPESLLVYASTRNAERPDIFIKQVDGVTLTQLTSDPADDIQPRFSPDGKRVVFCSNRGGSWDIWLVNRDGTGLTQLTSDYTDEVAPCWSPDGSQIAYTVWGHRSRQWEIWTLSLSQPGVRRFLAYGMFPDWSPDGGRIAFQRARQRGSHLFSVWIIELVDGNARQPTEVAHRDNAACIAPRWSPDGDMLVYCVASGDKRTAGNDPGTPGAADIWVVDITSGTRMKLTDGAHPAFNPVWADGGRVYFVSAQAGTENVWSLTTQLGTYAKAAAKPQSTSGVN